MRESQETKQIYGALIKARTEIVPVSKTRTADAGKYRYKYASLDSVLDMLSLVCPKHGLGFVQSIDTQEGRNVLTTRIFHESGEWVESQFVLPQTRDGQNESQAIGAAITYFKRYSLSALFGIATDDDTDGARDVLQRKRIVQENAKAARSEPIGDSHDEQPQFYLTGDADVDAKLNEIFNISYRGCLLFSGAPGERLRGMIQGQTPQDALSIAHDALEKMKKRHDDRIAQTMADLRKSKEASK